MPELTKNHVETGVVGNIGQQVPQVGKSRQTKRIVISNKGLNETE